MAFHQVNGVEVYRCDAPDQGVPFSIIDGLHEHAGDHGAFGVHVTDYGDVVRLVVADKSESCRTTGSVELTKLEALALAGELRRYAVGV